RRPGAFRRAREAPRLAVDGRADGRCELLRPPVRHRQRVRGRCATRRRQAAGIALASPRHVVVCGAGVIGASVAYFLTCRGIRVTIVERTGVACAASGKSGGFLALDWCDGSPVGELARVSFALHAELARQLGADYGYRRMDTFMMAARERGSMA